MSARSVAGEPATYRFGPRDRRGLIAGLRAGQVLVLALSLALSVGSLRSVRGAAGVLLAGAGLCAGAGLAFWPLRGRTAEEWAPVAARYVVAQQFRSPSAGARTRRDPRPGPVVHQPHAFRGLEVVSVQAGGRSFGVVRDRRERTVTAVLALAGSEFPLLGGIDRDRRVAGWSGVLAAVAQESGAVHRLQWVERTVPDRAEQLAGRRNRTPGGPVDRPLPGGRASDDYAALLDEEGSGHLRHEVLLACTVRDGTGAVALEREIASLARRCGDAGIALDGVLSAAGLRAVLARALAERPPRTAVSWPWPLAVRASWAEALADGLIHVTYWVAEWPRSDVASDFLLPLLLGCGVRRTVSVVMAPVPPLRAVRAAEHANTSKVADAELRRRHGFAVTARNRREHDAVERREQELAAGHVGYRFSGYVTVSAASPAEVASACGRVEQAAALARLELRRLYGSQDEALLFGLPLGRGCR